MLARGCETAGQNHEKRAQSRGRAVRSIIRFAKRTPPKAFWRRLGAQRLPAPWARRGHRTHQPFSSKSGVGAINPSTALSQAGSPACTFSSRATLAGQPVRSTEKSIPAIDPSSRFSPCDQPITLIIRSVSRLVGPDPNSPQTFIRPHVPALKNLEKVPRWTRPQSGTAPPVISVNPPWASARHIVPLGNAARE